MYRERGGDVTGARAAGRAWDAAVERPVGPARADHVLTMTKSSIFSFTGAGSGGVHLRVPGAVSASARSCPSTWTSRPTDTPACPGTIGSPGDGWTGSGVRRAARIVAGAARARPAARRRRGASRASSARAYPKAQLLPLPNCSPSRRVCRATGGSAGLPGGAERPAAARSRTPVTECRRRPRGMLAWERPICWRR